MVAKCPVAPVASVRWVRVEGVPETSVPATDEVSVDGTDTGGGVVPWSATWAEAPPGCSREV